MLYLIRVFDMIINLSTRKKNRFEIAVKQPITVTQSAGIRKRESWDITCYKYHYLHGYSYIL